MKRLQEIKVETLSRIFIMLLAISVLSVSCQNSDKGPANTAGNTNTQPSGNAEVKQAMSRDGQNNNQASAATTQSSPPVNNINGSKKPGIKITDVPSKGAGPDAVERIAGRVSGVKVNDFKGFKVIVFAHTNTWYIQPYIDSSDTSIKDDGTWENDTHLGSEYAALLVKSSYTPPTKTGTLPNVGGPIVAIDRATAKR